MGRNARYGSDVSDDALNMFLTRARPISLSADELGADPAAAQQPQRDPIDVDAWVRFPETPVRVCGRAVAWTDRAVCVEFTMKDRATHRAWVWASAVDRRSAR